MSEMPDCPQIQQCQCRQMLDCICGTTEKALRAWMNGLAFGRMSSAQREWCLSEIDSVEGWDRNDYKSETDAALARAVLNAWQDYCRDKGLL